MLIYKNTYTLFILYKGYVQKKFNQMLQFLLPAIKTSIPTCLGTPHTLNKVVFPLNYEDTDEDYYYRKDASDRSPRCLSTGYYE